LLSIGVEIVATAKLLPRITDIFVASKQVI